MFIVVIIVYTFLFISRQLHLKHSLLFLKKLVASFKKIRLCFFTKAQMYGFILDTCRSYII